VGDVILRAEQVDYLIVAAVHDRLLKGHEVGPKLAEAVDEHRPALGPRPRLPHRLSVATRTSPIPVSSITSLPSSLPARELAVQA
jgi:hypothetical protein